MKKFRHFFPLILIGLLFVGASMASYDFSKAGYREGAPLPVTGTVIDMTTRFVVPNDNIDDTANIQAAIDSLKGIAGPNNRYILQFPAGTIDISDEIHIDVDGIIIKGMGTDPTTGTKFLFKPWSAYSVLDGEPVIDGKIWPGRAAFRVETRIKHEGEQNYEGSINFHWKSGIKVAGSGGGTQGDNRIYLASGGGSKFRVGQTIYVGACNTVEFLKATYVKPEDYRNEHMRTQMFKITAISGDTLTIDKPLEFDIPYSNNGQIEGTTYYSKVMPVTAIRDVGFQDFYFEGTLSHTKYANTCNAGVYNAATNPGGVGYRYQNAAPEYAVHGILFKFVEDCWVKNVRMYMTPSHPIVTEFAHHITFDGNYLDGSWNKGKGGHGYFRCSKSYEGSIINNTVNHLRHLALQWSATGNVVKGNNLTCDINFHGGWERNNWIEGNTSVIPFEHRSWTEEGPENETWYNIWWASGQHAGDWAGASGYNNILYNNNFKKQEVEGGSYNTYSLYSNTNLIHLGWNGSGWEHLKINGTPITTWGGYQNVDFAAAPNSGVYVEGEASSTPTPITTPNSETIYNAWNTANFKAFYCDVDKFPFDGNTANRNSINEATSAQYTQIRAVDGASWTTSNPGSSDEVLLWLETTIAETGVTSLKFTFAGCSEAASDFSIWALKVSGASAWQTDSNWVQVGSAQTISANMITSFTRTLTANLTDYIAGDGKIIWAIFSSGSSVPMQVDYVGLEVAGSGSQPTATPTPTATMIPGGSVITVSTGFELQTALMNATAGTTILVNPGVYTVSPTTITVDNGIGGTVSRTWFFGGSQINGIASAKIVVKSANPSNPAILDGAGWSNAGYTLYIRGDYWEISDLKIRSGAKGIMLDNANHCSIINCEVYEMGQEAIHVRDGSSYTLIDNCYVHDSGKLNDGFGEGIYIGSDNSVWVDGDGVVTGEKGKLYSKECHYNTVKNCTLGPNITAEPIEIKEGTTNTVFEYCVVRGPGVSGNNYADSHFDIKGCWAIIRYCTFYQDGNTTIEQSGMIVPRQNAGVPAQFTAHDNYIHDNTFYIASNTYILKANSGSENIYAWNNTKIPNSGNFYSSRITKSAPAGYDPPGSTPTPTPTVNPTPTATPTPTKTPTPTPGGGTIKVQYDCDETDSVVNRIKPLFKIYNTGTANIDIASIKIRYYYTIDGEQSQSFNIDHASGVATSNCVGSFVKMASPKTGADYYMELSFKSGSGVIAPGGSIQVKTRWNKTDWSKYTQTGDYSFDPAITSYTDYTKTTGYVNGAKVWGTEP